MASTRDAFSSGANRAAGERARRNGTPLIGRTDAAPPAGAADAPPPEPGGSVKPPPESAKPAAQAPHRPQPRPRPRREGPPADAVARPRRKVDGARLSVVRPASSRAAKTTRSGGASPAGDGPGVDPQPARHRPHPVASSVVPVDVAPSGMTSYSRPERWRDERPEVDEKELAAALNRQELAPRVEDLMAALIGALRTVAAASGKRPDEVEETVARTLSYLARRVTGRYVVDDFGFDKDWTEHVFLPFMRVLYRQWFRVEVRGIENIPDDGSALIVSNHAGTIAFDALMVQVAVHDEHPKHRNLRLLGGDLVFRTPIIADFSRKQGSTLAANVDAERLLSRGELVGVFPEGYKGVGKPFSERYKLQRFGRGGFVSAAVRTGTPIIPLSVVGSEETYPLLANVPALARLLNTPYFPITPTWPWLGLLGLVPLPSKWIMEFGEPVPTDHMGKAAAEDPMLVFDLTDQIRETIQQTLYSLLSLRRTVFS